MQNFGYLVQGKHFKIRGKMVGVKNAFLTERWPYLGNGGDMMKIIDLG